jgi:hypothetical protein
MFGTRVYRYFSSHVFFFLLQTVFQHVLVMPDEDGRKMEEIRKYSAIYGRFDCKRKAEKPLTLHEVS